MQQAQQTYDAFLKLAPVADDALLANLLAASFDISSKCNSSDIKFQNLVSLICKKPGPTVNAICAQILWQHKKILTEEAVEILLDALESLDPQHKGTVSNLDTALGGLLDTAFAATAIDFLKRLLLKNDGAIRLADFDSFCHRITRRNPLFQQVIVNWLVSGQHVLCDGLSRLVSGRDDHSALGLIAAADIPTDSVKRIFLARKAIGYFFIKPILAASVVISIIRDSDAKSQDVLGKLLFDPLLRNYGGELKDFLSKIASVDAAYSTVQDALKKNEAYIEALRSVGELKEMKPSESQRETVHRRDSDQIRESHKAAQKESILLSLVHRSVILYGRRTLTVVRGPNDERRLMEMDLQSHSFGIEMPRSTITDPVGLDLMLRIFRREQLRDEVDTAGISRVS